MINQDFIVNQISSLGSSDFDIVVSFVLKDILGRQIANVNGNGDGGCDIREFRRATSQDCEIYQEDSRIGVRVRQVTVQNNRWMQKALNDAKNAKTKLGIMKAFQFFTSRVRSQTELKKLESQVMAEIGVPAECFGAREIAGLIYENHAFSRLATRLNRDVPDSVIGKPSVQLKFLHTLFAFHEDRDKLRSEIYEAVLLNKLYELGTATRDVLVSATADFLARKGREDEINGRIDSLLNGKIIKAGDNLVLSSDTISELDAANNCFKREIVQFANDVSEIVTSSGGTAQLDADIVQQFAVSVAGYFARHQCQLLNKCSGSTLIPLPLDFGKELDINRFLIDAKVPHTKIEQARLSIVEKASGNALIKRLANAVIFAWSEYGTNCCSVLALGVYDWKSVCIMLDTNVAIPYLLMSYFAPTEDRFSDAVNTIISVLKDRGCRIVIPHVYLEECAGHLRDAWKYRDIIDGNLTIMRHSENAFVAYYCQLRLGGVPDMPTTFSDYISALSSRVMQEQCQWRDIRGIVQNELNIRFNGYGIDVQDVHVRRDDSFRKEIETEYSYLLDEKGVERHSVLVDHDITVISSLKTRNIGGTIILLTNDGVLKSFAPRLKVNDRLIIGPAEASDLFQSSSGMSNAQLNSLAIAFASSSQNMECDAAKFIDILIEMTQNGGPDWKLVSKIESLVSDYLREHANVKSSADNVVKRSEVKAFLEKRGFILNEKDDESNEV